MLNVIEYGKDEYEFPALLVLGCFDAIHLGHRELIKKAKLQAKINGLDLGVMVFREGKGGKLVYSFEERMQILEQLGVKFVVAIDFNDEFKAIAPLSFLKELEDKINVKAYMSGKDFRFGAQQKGKSATLKAYAEDEENGVWYMPIKEVDLDGERVSTTLIKACLDEGSVAKADKLLGERFFLSGEVIKGEGRGTALVGFPTVNIDYPDWKHELKQGVYSVISNIDGVVYVGVANYGNCPTFGDDRVTIEVYFENFRGDLYGRTLTLEFVEYLRDIKQFSNAEELGAQLKADVESAKSIELEVKEAPATPVVPATASGSAVVAQSAKVEVQPVNEEAQPAKVETRSVTTPAIESANEQPAAKPVVPEVKVEQPVAKPIVPEVKPVIQLVVQSAPVVAESKPLTAEEKKKAFIASLEEDYDVDMSLIKALPQFDEPKEDVIAEEVKAPKPEPAPVTEPEVDFSKLESGFDEVDDGNGDDE